MNKQQLYNCTRGFMIVLYALSGGTTKTQPVELVRRICADLDFPNKTEEEMEALRKQALAGELDFSSYLS